MSFLRQWEIATEKTCKASWHGMKNGLSFRCCFCGHRFQPSDEYRSVYTNDGGKDTYGGNPLICRTCWDANDGYEGSRKKWKELHDSLPWWAVLDYEAASGSRSQK